MANCPLMLRIQLHQDCPPVQVLDRLRDERSTEEILEKLAGTLMNARKAYLSVVSNPQHQEECRLTLLKAVKDVYPHLTESIIYKDERSVGVRVEMKPEALLNSDIFGKFFQASLKRTTKRWRDQGQAMNTETATDFLETWNLRKDKNVSKPNWTKAGEIRGILAEAYVNRTLRYCQQQFGKNVLQAVECPSEGGALPSALLKPDRVLEFFTRHTCGPRKRSMPMEHEYDAVVRIMDCKTMIVDSSTSSMYIANKEDGNPLEDAKEHFAGNVDLMHVCVKGIERPLLNRKNVIEVQLLPEVLTDSKKLLPHIDKDLEPRHVQDILCS